MREYPTWALWLQLQLQKSSETRRVSQLLIGNRKDHLIFWPIGNSIQYWARATRLARPQDAAISGPLRSGFDYLCPEIIVCLVYRS